MTTPRACGGRDKGLPLSSTRGVERGRRRWFLRELSLAATLAACLSLAACAADPPPPPEAPGASATGTPAAAATPAPPATPCEALSAPTATLRRLASIVSFGRSMPVRPLHPIEFATRLDEIARDAKAAPIDDPELAKLAADAVDRLTKIAASARAFESKPGSDRARVALLDEMERGELVVVQAEQRCEKGGGASGGRFSAAALESGTGRMSAAGVQRALRSGSAAMRQCHEVALRRDPNLAGSLRVRYVVARDGTVASADAADRGPLDPFDWATPTNAPPLRDADVVACVLTAFKRISFPKPEGGTFTATYTLELGRAP